MNCTSLWIHLTLVQFFQLQAAGFVLFSHPVFLAWEKAVGVHTKHFMLRVLARIPMVAVMWLIALAVPFLGPINSVIGAFGVAIGMYSIPAFVFILTYRTSFARQVCQPGCWPIANMLFSDIAMRFYRCSRRQGKCWRCGFMCCSIRLWSCLPFFPAGRSCSLWMGVLYCGVWLLELDLGDGQVSRTWWGRSTPSASLTAAINVPSPGDNLRCCLEVHLLIIWSHNKLLQLRPMLYQNVYTAHIRMTRTQSKLWAPFYPYEDLQIKCTGGLRKQNAFTFDFQLIWSGWLSARSF